MTTKIKPSTSSTINETYTSTSTNNIIISNTNNFNKNSNINTSNGDDKMDNIWKILQENTPNTGLDGSNVSSYPYVRPLNTREIDLQSQKCIKMIGGTEIIVVDLEVIQEHQFNFNFCFDTTSPDTDPSTSFFHLFIFPPF